MKVLYFIHIRAILSLLLIIFFQLVGCFFFNIHIKQSKVGIELTIDLKLRIFFFRIQIGIFIITFN